VVKLSGVARTTLSEGAEAQFTEISLYGRSFRQVMKVGNPAIGKMFWLPRLGCGQEWTRYPRGENGMSPLLALSHPIILLVLFSAWIWCVVDALRSHRPWGWVIFVGFVPILSVPFYILNFRVLSSGGTGALEEELRWTRRLRELEERAAETDVPAVHREIADLYFQRGQYRRALESLKKVLDVDPEDLKAQYQAGVSMASLGRWREAIAHLDYLVDTSPRYAGGEAELALANAYLESGDSDRAFHHLATVVKNHHLPEAAVRYARMLQAQGYGDRATECLTEMLERADDVPKDRLGAEKKWITEARRLLGRNQKD
jgi:tetratricopeptide (TPR) repeat protein